VAIGSFIEDEYYARERAGFAGLGDVEAYIRLKEQLRRIGVHNFNMGPGHDISSEHLRENLILIGGPHSNPISAAVMEKLPLTFSFGPAEGPNGKDAKIYDSKTGAVTDCRVSASGRLKTDQGIIVRCANPFFEEKSVVMLAGSWGFGTTAATRLFESRDFLRHPIVNSNDSFEAVFTCDITEVGRVGPILLGAVRRIPHAN
jgi:hypothetical protein